MGYFFVVAIAVEGDKMILSGHQPVYLPGVQLFNKIALSDAFMFVGHCQYSPKSWQTRNYIKTGMLSVPVYKGLGQSIKDTKLTFGTWRKKHVKSIEMAYGKSEFFEDYFPEMREIIEYPWNSLASLNECLIELLMEYLEIPIPVYYSLDNDITGHKTDMLISMCKAVGADQYLSNVGADYVDEAKMAEAGIRHRWQVFSQPFYGQGETNGGLLSVIDLLFAKGPEAGKIVRESGNVG